MTSAISMTESMAREAGWDSRTQLELLCDFVEGIGAAGALQEYLEGMEALAFDGFIER